MLYLKDVQREKKDTLYTFLKRCINPIGVLPYKSKGAFPTTYKNENYSDKECDSKFRSLEAIIEISKTYFKVSDKHVAKVVKKICLQDKTLALLFCKMANKWIFYEGIYSEKYWKKDEDNFTLNYDNSINKKDNKGKGKYTYNEIRELMDN